VDLRIYGDREAWAQISFHNEPFTPRKYVQLDAASAAVLATSKDLERPSGRFANLLYSLHFAHFGGYLLKAFYAALAIALCAVTLSGTLIWVERRDALRARRGTRFLERFTVGGCAGLVLASAAYFTANRALGLEVPGRSDLEANLFYGVWLLACAAAFVPAFAPRAATRAMLVLASAGYGFTALKTLSDGAPLSHAASAVLGLLLGLCALSGAAAFALSGDAVARSTKVKREDQNDEEVVHADLSQTETRA
jgi:hypothetical protein